MKAIRRFTVRPLLPEALHPLSELARNLRWAWHAETRDLFQSVDPERWAASGGDPVRLLGSVSTGRLAELAEDRRFLRRLTVAADELRDYVTGDRWYQGQAQTAELPAAIAYFSPEFGITAALPQYSGGLGILAGDHLKAASDLGVPLIGVGLLYRHGYFRQSLSRDGWQQEHYPVLDPNELPLVPLHESDGSPAQVGLALPGGRLLHARIWQAQVGRVPLLLLDSDVEENALGERGVTDRLYGGGSEHRLLQEMLLGIGGVRAVRAYCRLTGHPAPEVFHTNEGHAGFLGLERIAELSDQGLDFDAGLEAVRSGTVFTTHTPVPAGIDRFDRELVARHFGPDAELPRIDVERILGLGMETYSGGDPNVFNMAVMGLRLAQRANGVSLLHGNVSREMFSGLWPGFDPDEVPITSVTNGVHAPTWVAPEVFRLGARQIGAERTEDAMTVGGSDRWDAVGDIPDQDIWELRRVLREQLVQEVRERLYASWRQRGAGTAELGWIEGVLDPDVLTIGFARRVPSYKRLTLMLRDQDRLMDLLLHPERPVQIVVAGKAHPADDGGKRLIQELVRFADDPRVRHRIVFLPDYGMAMAQKLYPGCDVWLNNPLRPLEACGTSGMKAALNGCLNLSVLDGWWDEWFKPDFGWAIPTADGTAMDEDRRDDVEAAALYDLLEQRVAPRFYERGPSGLPDRWIEMVRQTLTHLGPKVLAGRMVSEYVERLYAPAARAHRALTPDTARELAGWKARVRSAWHRVTVDHVETSAAPTGTAAELGASLVLRVRVGLGDLAPDDVEVQAVSGRVDNEDRITDATYVPLKPTGGPDEGGGWVYEGPLSLDRTGPFGYTVRILPAHRLLASTAELGLVAVPAEEMGEGAGVLMR
ncbi:glycosyltransferase family 1 protein [Streptomyces ipomoeae]|uniref:glycogen phosphorylase n=3 Tax=Streptomyces ipomoeae TaxID=103232 RepID=L1KZ00_9ACTN|nr:glycosyltransferase family 1 protein [Streptomyces ipomoeae]EKX66056.1 alpha-glucan phosphorylase [Streptomyces ipomoeae 91-03]MDX2693356.1 glycosyltransferase family 1 protein [Streptomyces ipomoeae]MDX2827301.1 glycosyltransferase family 1 protein [Streptomyces ipomoeae]MDX2838996.1 glycosyltransferase family 1 protein [Streptomyces ipomoeae]TQE22549.1 glycosyltransferase family 1 protein [Streptomyces ipomoeae]